MSENKKYFLKKVLIAFCLSFFGMFALLYIFMYAVNKNDYAGYESGQSVEGTFRGSSVDGTAIMEAATGHKGEYCIFAPLLFPVFAGRGIKECKLCHGKLTVD